jgi:hypothetical protein
MMEEHFRANCSMRGSNQDEYQVRLCDMMAWYAIKAQRRVDREEQYKSRTGRIRRVGFDQRLSLSNPISIEEPVERSSAYTE